MTECHICRENAAYIAATTRRDADEVYAELIATSAWHRDITHEGDNDEWRLRNVTG
ncbi:Uncharacterised protein [Mycobacterium tuberculosis]|nr:Uncharacterised protein [Mycobacterium tuberculosis]